MLRFRSVFFRLRPAGPRETARNVAAVPSEIGFGNVLTPPTITN